MGFQPTWGGVLGLILSVAGSLPVVAGSSDPNVKKSNAGICHERGTANYERTIHFEAFENVQTCLKSGGRLPKNRLSKKSNFDPSTPAHAGDIGVLYGQMVRVVDGDTLIVRIQGAEVTFRLSGIDAPERDQPFGREAENELEAIVGLQQCVLQVVETDSFGRTVAHLWIGDLYVNAEMMRRGLAWFDSEYAQNESLYLIEEAAREQERGLWTLPPDKRVPPWEWRHEKR
jgi:endonuclease YncB( thermonuclease family)